MFTSRTPIRRESTLPPKKIIRVYKNYFSSKQEYEKIAEENTVKITEKDFRNIKRMEKKQEEQERLEQILLGLEKMIIEKIPLEGEVLEGIKKNIRKSTKVYLKILMQDIVVY